MFTSVMSSTVSMLEFRRNAEGVLRRLQRGQRLVLTYRGKPVARLEPVHEVPDSEADAIYRLEGIAGDQGESVSNAAIDRLVYGR